MRICIAPVPPAAIRADRVEWGETCGVVRLDYAEVRAWGEEVMRGAFWWRGMALVATSLTCSSAAYQRVPWEPPEPPGTLVLEPLLRVLDRHYLLGLTALTWPTHDQPDFRDSGANDIGLIPARWR